MKDIVYTYHKGEQAISITGFIASLLQQGEDWDIRCLAADMQDYHAHQYSRMDPTIALQQELQWYFEFLDDEELESLSLREELITAGLRYLQWRVKEQIMPLSHAEKLNIELVIRINEDLFFHKMDSTLVLFEDASKEMLDIIVDGFPAQLLTYAACTTMDAYIRQNYIHNPLAWVDNLIGWLQDPSAVMIHYIEFDLPDVYALYENFLQQKTTEWEEDNRRRYRKGEPQTRYFMQNLLQQTRQESRNAIEQLSPFLSEEQTARYAQYLHDCQQYIADHIVSKRQLRSMALSQYFHPKVKRYPRNLATKKLREAATHPTAPAAQLAKVVKHLQSRCILVSDLHPHTHFIAVINKVFGTQIKHDSFSKHFRRP